jgi:DNA-binding transcriptional regulator PaaX
MYKLGKNQKKIMLVLLGGIALGCSGSSSQYFNTFRKIKREWKNVDRRSFDYSIKRLSRCKLIEEKKLTNGSLKLTLTKEGRKIASRLSFLGGSVNFKKPEKWDKKWRIVIFDIPERDREFRDILRKHLFALEFYKLQQSVFVSPYPCENLILKLVSLYSAQKYVRVATATKIDNEDNLKKHFFK